MAITAKDLKDLLAVKHSSDVFVPECKNGPTHSAGKGELLKLDAWAMSRSWANPVVWGYEIKVTRQDFLQDEKWRGYLPYCNRFAFVCPRGVVESSELPADVGLIWSTKNGGRLLTKRKPVHREVDIPENIFRYVLMCRARVCDYPDRPTNLEQWQGWLEEKREKRVVGYNVGRELREMFDEQIRKVQSEQLALDRRLERLADAQALLEDLGVRVNGYLRTRDITEAVGERRAAIPERYVKLTQKLRDDVNNLAAMLATEEAAGEV